VKVQFKAKGETLQGSLLAKVDAGALVTFSKACGVVLQSAGVRVREILEGETVARGILELFKKKKWDKEWVFVDQVYEAGNTTILISDDADTSIDLRATANLAGALPLSTGVELAFKNGAITNFIAAQGLVPLFHLSRVRQTWFESLFSSERVGKIGGVRSAARPRGRKVGSVRSAARPSGGKGGASSIKAIPAKAKLLEEVRPGPAVTGGTKPASKPKATAEPRATAEPKATAKPRGAGRAHLQARTPPRR
jgi:hypothetical protein